MEARLRQALARAEEVSRELSDPATARDSKRLTTLGREHARLVPIVRTAERLRRLEDELAQAREMAQEADPELVALARADLDRLPAEVDAARAEVKEVLADDVHAPKFQRKRDRVWVRRAKSLLGKVGKN
mgnify:CR=1 FL=1